MNKKLKNGLMFVSFLLVLGILATAEINRQEYNYNADINVYPDSIDLAVKWCNSKNITPLSECADHLIEQRLDAWYFTFINGEAQKQLNRITSSKNVSAILEANQTLSQIGN